VAIAWPASGVALAAFHLLEHRRWWLLALGVGLSNLFANWAVGVQLYGMLAATAADLLEAMCGALVLERFARKRVDMTEPAHLVALFVIATSVTPICAVLGTIVPVTSGGASFVERWRQWFIVDGVGILLVAPAVLGVAGWAVRRPRPLPTHLLEQSAVLLVTVVTTWVAIAADINSPGSAYTSRYLVFPCLALSALRAGPAGAAVTALLMSITAIASAIASTRVLSHDVAANVVLSLQLFVSVATVTTLGISSLEAHRRRAHQALLQANRELESRGDALEREVRRSTESEERVAGLKDDLADVIDSMPLALIAVDQHDVIGQWNRRAEAVVGLPAERALGLPAPEVLAEFWPALELSRIKRKTGEWPDNERLQLERVRLEREDGLHSYNVTFYPLARGYIQGGVIMIGDVTDQVRLQEVILQTEKMISLGGLAAGMAHEINNPLGIVAQAAQNVQRRTSTELAANRVAAEAAGISLEGLQRYLEARGVHQFITDIRGAAARAAVIVTNMLEFSRRSPSAMVAVDLAEVLERAVVLAGSDFDLRKHYDFRRVRIVRNWAQSLPPVQGVVIELEQVFLNLIKNAAQAMSLAGHDDPRITLSISQEDKYAVVVVEDNGPGMDEATRRRVFEPFFTTKDPGVGTGLGLSVSFSIITGTHKGTISVHSSKGGGAAFTIRLPFASEATS